MNVLKYRVSLDMFDTHSQTTIKAKKSDSACQIHITLSEKGKIYNIGEGCSATFNARKSDGNFIYDNCTIENNTIVYDFTSSVDENGVCQVSACEGTVDCEVTLYNADGKQLTSPRFTLFIDGTVYNGEEIASTPQSDFFKEIVAEAVSGKMDKFGTTDFYGSVTLFGRTIYSKGKKAFLTLDDVGAALQSNGVLVLNAGTQIEGNNKPLKKISTPDGTDPTQAANVEFVVNERRMKLIADHTVTAEEASEGKAWKLSMSKINNGIPLDKVHIVYDIPNSTTITSNTTISARINGGMDLGSFLQYVPVNKNAYGPFWVEAEKIAENKWRSVRTGLNPNITNSIVYANYFLGSVDVIDSIIIEGIPFEGINIKVWGRDAI